jgi:hypothetical protein
MLKMSRKFIVSSWTSNERFSDTINIFFSLFQFVSWVKESSHTVLFIIFKGSNKNCSIWILDIASTMHIVILEFSSVNRSIVHIFCSSYDFMVFEFSFIDYTVILLVWFGIIENVLSFAMKLTVFYLSSVCFNSLFVNSISCSLSIFKISFVLAFSEIPLELSLSMHSIHVPFSIINRPVMNLSKASITMGFSINPVTLVNVSIWVGKSTFTIVSLIGCLALIQSTILKSDFTDSFPLTAFLSEILTLVVIFSTGWVSDWCPVVVPYVK